MRRRLVASALCVALIVTCANADGGTAARTDVAAGTQPSLWSGFYLGGHLGYAWGGSDWSAQGPVETSQGSFEFFRPYDLFKGTGSYFSGLQAGYNYRLPSGVVLGAQADLSAPNTIMDLRTISSAAVGQASLSEKAEMSGTVRARLGFVRHDWLLYAMAGYAWSSDLLVRTQLIGTPVGGAAVPGTIEKANVWRNGWTIGTGVEVPVASKWTASLEYLFTSFGSQGVSFPAGAQGLTSDLTMQSARLALNYQFGDENNKNGRRMDPAPPDSDSWSVHAQTTFVQQYAFPFRAPYRGANSLDPNAGRETWDATFYLGARLWRGAELWINPEIPQGFGLTGTVGLAGFSSGEAYKQGANDPYARLPRYFIRQTIGLGGEAEKVEAAANQFGGSQSKDRLVITAGKFSATDVFDTNKYAHDPRVDFLNWAVVDTGTFDYAADAWAFTYGAAVEWYRGAWTIRGGLFDLPIVPNSTDLDPTFKQFQWIGEVERRHEIGGQAGKLAITGFLTEGRMGRFEEAVQLANLTGQPAEIAAVRRFQSRPGISFNFEQQVNNDFGIFVRGGWSDGRFEPFAFTDIDRTIAAGVVVSGKRWGRSDDTLGFAGVVNGITGEHVAYLNAGGLTGLLGDGKLPHPGPERILETYYSFPLSFWRVTADYQLIENPGFNRDRGPVSVIGTRVRAQF